jgi:hypothetical protein
VQNLIQYGNPLLSASWREALFSAAFCAVARSGDGLSQQFRVNAALFGHHNEKF